MRGLRAEKKRRFSGKVYERCGQSPSKKKSPLASWARFQRRVNNNNVRIVKAPGGYEAYMRKRGK